MISTYLLSITEIITVLALVCLIFFLIRKKKSKRQYQTGLIWLKQLADLLNLFQNHRGLTTGFLSGDQSLEKKVILIQRNVLTLVDQIERTGTWINDDDRWRSINDHWSRIQSTYLKKSVKNNAAEHNALIKNVLFLIDDMAKHHSLESLDTKEMSLRYLWQELLRATEFIGQARAIGTGIAAKGDCDSISTIKLNYLLSEVTTNCDRLWECIPFSEAEKAHVFSFLDCLNNRILHDKGISITPTEYFDTASRAIDCLRDRYAVLINQQAQQ